MKSRFVIPENEKGFGGNLMTLTRAGRGKDPKREWMEEVEKLWTGVVGLRKLRKGREGKGRGAAQRKSESADLERQGIYYSMRIELARRVFRGVSSGPLWCCGAVDLSMW
jgi:hypothetical protein